MKNYNYDISFLDTESIQRLVGPNDENLNLLQELYLTHIVIRDNQIKFLNDKKAMFEMFSKHLDMLLSEKVIDRNLIKQTYNALLDEEDTSWRSKVLAYTIGGKPILPKTYKQYQLVESIANNELTFGIGPAGTGKTYLAVLMAVKAYKEGQIKKIILTRPAVEAGESLGFLPGDLKEKIDPYLMPLYDALFEIMGEETVEKLTTKGVIEVIPLAYMRGRTLNEAFVILDEAQNTTSGQMLMFLTRLGFKSKMVVNGDVTQIDLNINKNKSGLIVALEKLKNIASIKFVEFNNNDIIRNQLVQTIIEHFN